MKSLSLSLRLGLTAVVVSLFSAASFANWVPVTGSGTPGYGGYVRYSNITPDGQYWVMTDGGGLHKSSDGGVNWTASNNGLGSLRVRAGLVSSGTTSNTDPSTYKVFAGTSGGGVFKSTDGGASFLPINAGLGCTYVTAIRGLSTRLLAGTDCQLASGVYYSDLGASWSLASGLPSNARVNSISQVNPAGTDYLLANTNSGIYKSMDAGSTWSALPSSPSGPNGAVIYSVTWLSYINSSNVATLRLIATVEGAGVFVSENGGADWIASNTGLPSNPIPLGAVNFNNIDTLFLSLDGAGTYKSNDRGNTWTLFAAESALPAARFVFGSAPTFYAGTVAGPFKSVDGGTNWVKGGAGLAGGMTSNISVDNTGKWYAGAADGVYERSIATSQWSKMPALPSMAHGHVLVRGTSVYAATSSFGIFKYNGSQWQTMNVGLPTNLVYRNPSLRIDSSNATGLYVSLYGAGVYYSANDGVSWTARNSGLSGDALKVHHLTAVGALVYISTEAGVYKSSDGGENWVFAFAPKNSSNQNLSASHVWIDQATTSTVYAGAFNTNAVGAPLSSNGVYKSTDSGATWTQLPGLAGKMIKEVKIVGDDNTLVASAWDHEGNGGIFTSNDGGVTWKNDSVGLTSNLINSVAAAGNGGGAFAASRGAGLFLYIDAPAANEWKYFGAWTNGGPIGYGVSYGAKDIGQTLSGITVVGGGQSAIANYWSDQSWHADLQFGNSMPTTGTVYTATVTPKVGAVTTTIFSMRANGYNTKFPTNIHPSGGANVTEATPVFSWSPPTVAGAFTYGINVQTAADNVHVWSAFNLTGTSVVYGGPTLIAGTLYKVLVQTQEQDIATNTTYGAMREESFCFQCAGIVGVGTNFDQIWISRNKGTGPEDFGLGVRYPRSIGDGHASYLIQCPNNAVASGQFNSAMSAGYEWFNVNLGGAQPATPFTCTSTVSYSNGGLPTVATLTIDRFADASNYPANIPIVPDASAASLSGVSFTAPALTSDMRVQANVYSTNANGSIGQQLWFIGSTPSPINFAGLPTLTVGAKYVLMVAVVDGNNTMHAAQSIIPFCYQCGATGGGSGSLNAVAGWNLLGNSNSAALDVAATFGDASKVITVWKWVSATGKWAFYAPSMDSAALAAYAASKGYDVLTTVAGGEGFWVNAKTIFNATLPAGEAITSASFSSILNSGWSLAAIGDNKTPRAFNNGLSLTPPSAGVVAAPVLTTLWAWNSVQSSWYFYAPSLDNTNGLLAYTTSKGYLDFGANVLLPGVGFWINKP